MAQGIDLTPLLDLMCNNEDVLKVFHAGGQDVEIIYNLTGKTPHPIFDTQIAMMAISQSEQIGYANLVEAWMGVVVDKGARFTDWGRRPLTERQIEYAIGDVTYLSEIFPKILKKLIKTGRGAWLDAGDGKARRSRELPQRSQPAVAQDPRAFAQSADPRAPARPRRLARSRGAGQEHPARPDHARRDPRRPRQPSAQGAGRPRQGARAVERVARERDRAAADEGDEERRTAQPPRKCPRSRSAARRWARKARWWPICSSCCSRSAAREMDVASRLLTRSDEMEALAAGVRGLPILEGWRYEAFGRDALELVEGRLAFAVEKGRLKMTRIEHVAGATTMRARWRRSEHLPPRSSNSNISSRSTNTAISAAPRKAASSPNRPFRPVFASWNRCWA